MAINEKEKELYTRVVEAFTALPEEKKRWWLGYIEGVLDATARRQEQQATADQAASA